MVHQVMADLAAVVAQPVGETPRGGAEKKGGGSDSRGVQEENMAIVFGGLAGMGVQDADAFGAVVGLVVNDLRDDAIREEGQIAGGVGGGEGGGVAAEIAA